MRALILKGPDSGFWYCYVPQVPEREVTDTTVTPPFRVYGSFLIKSGQAPSGLSALWTEARESHGKEGKEDRCHHAAAAPDHPAHPGPHLGEVAPSKEGQEGGAPMGGHD